VFVSPSADLYGVEYHCLAFHDVVDDSEVILEIRRLTMDGGAIRVKLIRTRLSASV